MLEWFRALMPKEDRFFGLFEQHAALVVAGAESLRSSLEGGPALHQHLQTVMDRENDADVLHFGWGSEPDEDAVTPDSTKRRGKAQGALREAAEILYERTRA